VISACQTYNTHRGNKATGPKTKTFLQAENLTHDYGKRSPVSLCTNLQGQTGVMLNEQINKITKKAICPIFYINSKP